jgi:hypothetical protein
MLPIQVKITRAQRLLRMLEQDSPLLAARVAPLNPERQQSAKSYAAELIAQTRAELERLSREKSVRLAGDSIPQPAD